MANSIFSKIVKSLWVFVAFIPFLNGLGFAYIGSKEFKSNWILEGLFYQIPWFLLLIFINDDLLVEIFLLLSLIFYVISIFRSLFVYIRYKDILIDDDPESHLDLKKSFSSFWVIFSVIIFINGFGLIFVGFKRNVKKWVFEGLLFEFLWILYILFIDFGDTVTGFLLSLAFIGVVLSIIRTFMVYFEEEKMDNYLNEYSNYNSNSNLNSNFSVVDESTSLFNENSNDLINENNLIPELQEYKNQVFELKTNFSTKEKSIEKLLLNRFSKEEMSYSRFKTVIDGCHNIFCTNVESVLNIINLSPEFSERIEKTLKNKIDVLNSIISEMDNLIEELIINDAINESSDDEIKDLLVNMRDLIDAVDDYN